LPKIQGITHQKAIRILKKFGFKVIRNSKHIIMSDGDKILTIPRANPINAYTMAGIVKDAGIRLKDFRLKS